MTDRELMQQALEALLHAYHEDEAHPKTLEAITAIKEALAQPEQEAQIIRWNCPCGNEVTFRGFTQAPHRKPLTDEEIWKVVDQCKGGRIDFARAIEAAHGIKE